MKVIDKREKDEEYMVRMHGAMQAVSIVKALGASFDGKEISLEELAGKHIDEMKEYQKIDINSDINEWKKEAKKRGLKTGS